MMGITTRPTKNCDSPSECETGSMTCTSSSLATTVPATAPPSTPSDFARLQGLPPGCGCASEACSEWDSFEKYE